MKHDERLPIFASIQTVVLVLHKENAGRLHLMNTVPCTYYSTTSRRDTSTAIELYLYKVPWSRILHS